MNISIKNSLSIILILFLTSCGGGGGNKTETTVPENQTTTKDDFNIEVSAIQHEFYIAYFFRHDRYVETLSLDRSIYVDDVLVDSGSIQYMEDSQDHLKKVIAVYNSNVKLKTVRITISLYGSDVLLHDKTVDISNVEIVIPPKANSGKK